MARKFLAKAKAEGIDLLVTCTYRSPEDQANLYRQGRTRPGKVVTNARPWKSWHQYRVAFDVVPIKNGKPIWNDVALWNRIGALGESVGLTWGGRWTSIVDRPHFQATGGKTMAQLRAEIS